jgi:hypothetical protein
MEEVKANKLVYNTKTVILPKTFVKPKIKHFGRKKSWKAGDGNLLGGDNQPDADWTDVIDKLSFSYQNDPVESMDCWSWNNIEAVRLLLEFLFGDGAEKWSKKFSGIMGGGTINGGSIESGCETIRKDGLLPEADLPWTEDQNTWYKFHSPVPMTQVLKDKAKKFFRKYAYFHDYVVYPGLFGKAKTKLGVSLQDAMYNTLKQCPLSAAVYAWYAGPDGLCINPFGQYNHLTVISGAVYGKYWIAHDSYQNCWRKLAWNYPFKWVKRHAIYANTKVQEDADYIKTTLVAKNVKGDESPAIYFIYGGEKRPYESEEEYNKICDEFIQSRDFTVVAQDALELIPLGTPMIYDIIKSTEPFSTPDGQFKKFN